MFIQQIARGFCVVFAALALVLLLAVPPLRAAEPDGSLTPLDVAVVVSGEINCKFTVSCVWPVQGDWSGKIPLAGTNGEGALQTRLVAVGEAGTSAAGLYPYLYRLNFFSVEATSPTPECVSTLTLPFGPIAPVDYDGDGELDDLFVVMDSLLAPAYLASAGQRSDGAVVLTLASNYCPDALTNSYFVGMASLRPGYAASAEIGVVERDGSPSGVVHEVEARVPMQMLTFLTTVVGE